MRVIFRPEAPDNSRCPVCKTDWPEFEGEEVACTNCGLSAQFLSSPEGKPDPITSLALEEIKKTGLKDFFTQTMRQRCSDGRSGAHGESRQQTLREWIDTQVSEFGPLPRPSRRKQSKIRHFKRVVFCDEQWPDIAGQFDRHSQLMASLVRPHDDTTSTVPRADAGLGQFLRAGLRANNRDATLDPSAEILTIVQDYIQQSRHVQVPFRESVLRARCLLWTLKDIGLCSTTVCPVATLSWAE
ncbi:hypothetical protein K456DRAFT_1761812 [Colletotrichum gloeosporioides 23]|nr:hypothetical protein K456DRAFT_1761812 [Colletotrichum gloeosporioides 23]